MKSRYVVRELTGSAWCRRHVRSPRYSEGTRPNDPTKGTNAMTANTMIDLTDFLGQQLAQAGRYLLRQMV